MAEIKFYVAPDRPRPQEKIVESSKVDWAAAPKRPERPAPVLPSRQQPDRPAPPQEETVTIKKSWYQMLMGFFAKHH
jgi:hypothetical protein